MPCRPTAAYTTHPTGPTRRAPPQHPPPRRLQDRPVAATSRTYTQGRPRAATLSLVCGGYYIAPRALSRRAPQRRTPPRRPPPRRPPPLKAVRGRNYVAPRGPYHDALHYDAFHYDASTVTQFTTQGRPWLLLCRAPRALSRRAPLRCVPLRRPPLRRPSLLTTQGRPVAAATSRPAGSITTRSYHDALHHDALHRDAL
ncbi:hypothetical protein BC936DRAFT_148167 [Jimgerdemannia flammicorona]|uniref:Uncharacterized protein n=1 Tax=Jimgerdemannia flammicorona TaxID=994334 RepID=A0A433D3U2_9FUNG|nr:hypothetical protein BC936DRAFT_148167 [Jimgerdemannia flammicorona]